MKKTSYKYVLMLLVCGFLASSLIVLAIFIGTGADGPSKITVGYIVGMLMFISIISSIPCTIIFTSVADSILSRSVKKLKLTFNENSLTPTSSFESNKGMFYIDTVNGKIAAIMKLNPFKLQILDAALIENARVDEGAVMSSAFGTRMVSFRFMISGQNIKIPTFTSRRSYSLKSMQVLTALSKADMQVNMLNEAKQVALKRIENDRGL